MFKSIFLATALVFSSMAVSAQSKQQTNASPTQSNQKRVMTPQERSVRVLRMMASKVNLSDTQQAEVKQVLLDREIARTEARNEDGTIKADSKESLKAANQKANDKLATILSPEQMKTWEEFKSNQKVRREQNKANSNTQQSRPEMEEDFY
jgi:hypothetical protein